jgi:SAM-dependent methyltransferase
MLAQSARRFARRADYRLQLELQRSFQRRLGVDTLGVRDLDDFGVAHHDRVYHATSPTSTLRRTLERIGAGPDEVFADIGSGKGQAVLVAAQLPYGRVIGVELAEELNAIARENVEHVAGRVECGDVELETMDALEWRIPDDLSVAYLYCPFVGATFDTFIERLLASHDANPRPLHIVYTFPFEHNRLIESGRVATVDVNSSHWPRRPGWWETDNVIVTYRVVPEGDSAEPEQIGAGFRQAPALQFWSRPNHILFQLHPPSGESLYSQPR